MSAESKPELPLPPLPPVQPPSASFLIPLFVVPVVIVTILVAVWVMIDWLAHMGANPQDLVRDIGRVNDASWQKAYNLAELLRKPQHDKLKDDPELAEELASTLTSLRASQPARKRDAAKETDEERKKRKDAIYDNRIKLEVFLCHVLGNFRVDSGLPALIEAAGPDPANDPEGFAVRSAALGAIAVQASEVDPAKLQQNEKLMETVIGASKETSDGAYGKDEFDKLRSAAAYTLGMIGGGEALERLAIMLDDPDPNVRYNACLGLSRHGDSRALPVLYEMLDPKNEEGLADPDGGEKESIQATGREWKRVQMMTNALRGARLMAKERPAADYRELIKRLKVVEQADLIEKVKLDAKDLRLELEKKS